MKTRLMAAALFFALFLGFVSNGYAQKDPNEENKSKQSKDEAPAKTVDFQAQLGMKMSALENLGNLIDNARKEGDANSLLSAAMILYVAENNSGKKAVITAESLLNEATELATLQKNAAAVQNAAKVWSNALFANNSAKANELNDVIKSIEAESGERGSGAKVVDVRVNNYTDYTIYVYIDGVYKGYLYPDYYNVYYNIGTGWTSFYAETDYMWIGGKYTYYYWSNSYNLTTYDYTTAADFTWSVY